ncbi:H+-ATPase G subunit-domain-containing protein [Neohortaea acidophila]|uniref:V-type proton ATPase subunit G n=1 Tax=Neohortaea acidophila TaxID=245834 RepID=A0A6A6PUD7_9PEZI|nr:H+-ATPase G subunit-domain-containing protein [Neohortaea acidophila]KAF2483602.1 H+-ATPase G subunit-domain-containing protein [Neohortaea acidophila]
MQTSNVQSRIQTQPPLFQLLQSHHSLKDQIVNMAASNSAGIQTLLDAEREAQKIVQKAREYRTKRVKDARSEAQKEIEDYKKEKEEEYKKYEKEQQSGNKQAEEKAEKDTQQQLEDLKQLEKKSGPGVVDDLLKAVVDVRPEVPDRMEQPVV